MAAVSDNNNGDALRRGDGEKVATASLYTETQ
jgi:hypothetical protein